MFSRRSVRLKSYDYAQAGAYFITLCTHGRACLFGEITNGAMHLNEWGEIVRDEWEKSSAIRVEIELDAFVIMPNHLHGIVCIVDPNTINGDRANRSFPDVGANGRSPLSRKNMGSKTLSSFVAGYKSAVTKRINECRQTPGVSVWQRNYYEHIIRNEAQWNRICEYIALNPTRWLEDENYSTTSW
jgi:putative transposase